MTTHRAPLLLAGLLLGVPALAQEALDSIGVAKLRRVLDVIPEPGGERAAFVRSEPRLAGDEPGPARLHLWLVELDEDGTPRERLLLGGDRRVGGVRWDPRTGDLTFSWKGEDDEHAEVWAVPAEGGEPRAVSDTPHGVDDHAWSPDGGLLAYTATDPRPEARKRARDAGFRQVVVDEDWRPISLWLHDRDSGESRKLTEGRAVFSFRWAPTGTHLAAAIAPRNLVDDRYVFTRLHRVDVESGEVTPLVDNPGKLGDYAWSPDGERLAYVSAVDRNDPHAGMLYVVGRQGGEPKALTPGLRGMVHDLLWGEREDGSAVLSAVISRGVESHLAAIDPDSGEILREEPPRSGPLETTATRGAWAGLGGQWLVGSTPEHPDEVWRADADGGYRRLTDSNPWLADVALARQEVVRFVARDGLQIEGLLLHPLQRQDGERRPLVIVAHGGPESHFGNGWHTDYARWGQLLAARGWFGWFPNYRASTGYGVAFAKADHGDPMGSEFDDHLDAIAHFDELGLVDPDRVAIGGGSYGGYTAAWAATRHSEHFAAAVSFVPFVDIRTKWLTSDIPHEFYYVHYQERWPHRQPGLLSDRSPLTWAPACDTPLLLLGGTADTRVHPSQPFMLYRAVKFATDTPVRYVQYPGEGHGNRTSVYRYDYMVRSLRWLEHYLRPGATRDDPPPPRDLDYAPWEATAPAGEEASDEAAAPVLR